MSESPRGGVGAPTELADAQEVPGCIAGGYKLIFGAPILAVLVVKEIITFPLDVLIFLYDKITAGDDA